MCQSEHYLQYFFNNCNSGTFFVTIRAVGIPQDEDPVLSIMLHAPLLLFWFVQERGFYCSEACEA